MESDDEFPGAWCLVCVAGLSCERPQCPGYVKDRPLDLSLKPAVFKRPSVLKRPTTLDIKPLSCRSHTILDRDMSSRRASTPKPEFPSPAVFGNSHPYGRVLAMGQMRREKQKVAERLVIL